MTNNLVYIDNQVALDQLTKDLENTSRIAIDLEFDKNHYTYGFNICLIQLFQGDKCYLIDPLTIQSLQSLFSLFEDPNVELVTFAFGEDYRLLRHLGCAPTNITDLSTVRSLLNRPQSSLTNVLIEELGVQSSKDLQRSNWCLRPLTEEQKLYAAEDVTFLFELDDKLKQELSDLNRLSWLSDEKEMLASSEGEVAPDFNSTYYKERKIMTLPQWERFKLLIEFREKQAERLNKPTYKVIDRELIADVAMKNDLSGWTNQKRVHPSLKKDVVLREMQSLLDRANVMIAANGIADTEPARPSLSHMERVAHSKRKLLVHQLSEDVLIPIKQMISEKYGENFSTFMLSKRMMEKVIHGEIKLPHYRLEIIHEAAKNLGFSQDVLAFLD